MNGTMRFGVVAKPPHQDGLWVWVEDGDGGGMTWGLPGDGEPLVMTVPEIHSEVSGHDARFVPEKVFDKAVGDWGAVTPAGLEQLFAKGLTWEDLPDD